jgi:PAS domain S-box-containing protein
MPAQSTTSPTQPGGSEIVLYEHPPKVMIVEDETIIALDIERQLIQAGFAVSGKAKTASEAFRQIERESPDIVLMDIHLKGEMDGVQAASIVRRRYALPVIYLTAHSDNATLARARATEPSGFILKPLTNSEIIKATITMAVYKHQAEQEIENNRRLLSTVLHGLPDAVLVAHPLGEVLFLNRSAEQITGWSLSEAASKSVFEIAPIYDNENREILPGLLKSVVAQKAPVRICRDSTILRKDGKRIHVSGQLSVLSVDDRVAGVFIVFEDNTTQKNETLRLGQERQMFVAGELAQGVAREFFGLFGMIDDAADGLSKGGGEGDLELIRKASRAGAGISTQLLELSEGFGTAHVVNVKQCLVSSQLLLKRLCGNDVKLEISALPDVGYVLATGNHFEQMLVSLVLEGRQRLGGPGSLIIGASIHKEPDPAWRFASYVRVFIRAERENAQGTACEEPFTLGVELPELGLAIVRAIATSAEGFTRVTEPDDSIFVVEVFLPRQESRIVATAATNEYSQVIMGVGLDPGVSEPLKNALGEDVLLLEAAGPDEAAWISELYEGDIDLVILNESSPPAEAETRARDRIRTRRPAAFFLQLSTPDDVSETESLELARRVKDSLGRKTQASSEAAG